MAGVVNLVYLLYFCETTKFHKNTNIMKKLTTILALLVGMLSVVGCQPDNPTTPTPEENPAFNIVINRVTKTSVDFSVKPLDKSLPYLLMIIDKETFGSFESEDAYIEDDIEYLQEVAEENDMTLRELLEEMLAVGDVNDSTASLSPDTEYYIYAYHMTYEGEIISELVKKEFKTEGYTFNKDGFEVSVSDVGYNSALVTVTPTSTSTPYFMNVLDEEQYEYYGGNAMAYVRQLEALRSYYLNMDRTTEEMIANLCFIGEMSLEFDELIAGGHYYAYALSVDDDFMACSEVEVVEFVTPKPTPSDNTFTVEIDNIYYDHVEGRVITSNDDPYICSIQHAASLESFDNDEDIYMSYLSSEFNKLNGGIEAALRRGTTDLAELNKLTPSTEYMIVCFGWNGAPTTDMFIHKFTTADINIEDAANLVVDFEITELSYSEMRVECTPSLGAWYFCAVAHKAQLDTYTREEGSVEAAIARMADEEIEYGADYFYCSRADYLMELAGCVGFDTLYFRDLEPNTNYVVYAVAVNIESGEIVSKGYSYKEFTTLEKVVGEATIQFVIGNYYDGSELAEIDAAQFNSCKGQVVVPYEIKTTSADTWYSAYFDGDYIEGDWCEDDDIVAMLVTYGAEMGVENVSVNRTSGIAVLRYDTAYTFMGIAKDAVGDYGKGVLHVVSFSKDGVSPAEEFIASLATPAQLAKSAPAVEANKKRAPVQHQRKTACGVMKAPADIALSKTSKTRNFNPTAGTRFMVVNR